MTYFTLSLLYNSWHTSLCLFYITVDILHSFSNIKVDILHSFSYIKVDILHSFSFIQQLIYFTLSHLYNSWYTSLFLLYKSSQRGFMGTIAYDYSRSIAEHSVNRRKSPAIAGDLPKRIVGLCPLGRAWWLALPKAICQSCSLQLCSPKINSPN